MIRQQQVSDSDIDSDSPGSVLKLLWFLIKQAKSRNQFANATVDETNRALLSEETSARETSQSSSQALKIIHSSLKSSLAYSISSSELIAVGILLSILSNITLLISSNTATGASVELFLTYESDTGNNILARERERELVRYIGYAFD